MNRKLLGVLAVVFALFVITKARPPVQTGPIPTGGEAQNFYAQTLDGQPLTLKGLRGKVVLLDFWATWCGPCRIAAPTLEALYKKYGPSGFVIVGMSVDDANSVNDLPGVVQSLGITYPVTSAPDFNYVVQMKYKATSLPSQYLIDRQGIVRWCQGGYSMDEDTTLPPLIEGLLAEK